MISGCAACSAWPCSAGWPGHRAATEDVGVHVIDRLPGLSAGIEDDAIPALGNTFSDRHLVGVGDEVGQQPVAGGRKLGQVGVMVPSYHKYVYGSLRINVAERDCPGISGHYGRRYVGGGNAAEQAVRHAEDLNVWRAGDAADIYGCSTANPRCTTPLVQRPRQLLASVVQG
jgi:hypothetical protein